MLLVQSVSFYFNYNICGCMCSTGPFKYRWLKGYIFIAHVIIIIKSEVSTFPIVIIFFSVVVCLRCLLHHILSLIAYTFRENREFVFIIIVLFMMSANSRISFAFQVVFVCLYNIPFHYHHCANLFEDIVECVSKIKQILSVIHYTIHYTICAAVCSLYPIPVWWLRGYI